MALRVDYLARETGQNLARNPLPAVATITTVGVALAMLAVSFLARAGISSAFEEWNNDVTFVVYMNTQATADQVTAMRTTLKDSPQVDAVTYLDDQATYEYAQRLFADDPEMLQSIKVGDLPTSFRVKPKNPDADVVRKVAQGFAAKPGVLKVRFVADEVRQVQRIGARLQTFLLGGSVILAIASVLLIFNTIQTAIFSRRREIEVMRLVGASAWYIRVPFVMEGVVQGLIGSAFAAGSAWLVTLLWRQSLSESKVVTLFEEIKWSNSDVNTTVIVVSLVGVLVSAAVAYLSTTFYLRE